MCGLVQAAHWATIHDTNGQDPEDYAPLCAKCHATYDRRGEKISQAAASKRHSAYDRKVAAQEAVAAARKRVGN
jgi:hypothetical protein